MKLDVILSDPKTVKCINFQYVREVYPLSVGQLISVPSESKEVPLDVKLMVADRFDPVMSSNQLEVAVFAPKSASSDDSLVGQDWTGFVLPNMTSWLMLSLPNTVPVPNSEKMKIQKYPTAENINSVKRCNVQVGSQLPQTGIGHWISYTIVVIVGEKYWRIDPQMRISANQ